MVSPRARVQVEYTHQLLSAYGRASEAAAIPAPDANYSRVASVPDLARLVQLCDCGATKAGAARQPTRARCAAQFGVDGARGAQRQRGGFDRFRAARCCEGWDCPRPVCEDGGRLGPNASVLMMRERYKRGRPIPFVNLRAAADYTHSPVVLAGCSGDPWMAG